MINKYEKSATEPVSEKPKVLQFLAGVDRQIIVLVVFLIVIMAVMTGISSHFLSYNNLIYVLQQSVFVMILAFGMTFVLSTGGIDLSVGSVLGISGGMTAWLITNNVNIFVAILAGLVLGMLIGVLNGLMITKLKIIPFVATLAMMSIARGILYIWTKAIPFQGYMKDNFGFLGQGRVLAVPFSVIVALLIFIILLFVYRKMRFGRHVLALGSNEESVRISGINVDSLRIKVYALSGLLSAIAGILLSSRLTTVHPEMGSNYELEAIAASVIGGTSLAGGKGSLVGTLLGAIVLFMIKNAMNIANINPSWETIVEGIIILAAVSLERLSHTSKKQQ